MRRLTGKCAIGAQVVIGLTAALGGGESQAGDDIPTMDKVVATAPRFDAIMIPSPGSRYGRSVDRVEFRRAETSDKTKDSTDLPCDKASQDGNLKGNPINIATGNKLEPELDFAAVGEWPLYLSRTYNWLWEPPRPGALRCEVVKQLRLSSWLLEGHLLPQSGDSGVYGHWLGHGC